MAIDTPDIQYQDMAAKWRLPDALWGDTLAMREAGKEFLPKRGAESDEDYKIRLNETTLVNYFGTTIKNLSGKIFQKPIVVGEELADQEEWLNNVDLCGSTISDFGHQILKASLRHGLTHVLVDMPKGGEAANLLEQQKQGLRPYLNHISAVDLIGCKHIEVNGVKTLVEIRIRGSLIVNGDDYKQDQVNQIRRIYLNTDTDENGEIYLTGGSAYELHQEKKSGKDKSWTIVDSGEIDSDSIDLVTYYTNRTGYMMAETYFTNVVHLNHQHWQSSSYQRNILNVARIPRLMLTGFSPEEIQTMHKHGVKDGIMSSNENAKGVWLEAKGDSIQHGERDLEDMEEKMTMLSLDPVLKKATSNQIATIANIESSKANSVMMQWAISLQESLIKCVSIMRRRAGLEEVDSGLKLNDSFDIITNITERVKELREIRAAGDMTRAQFLTELKRITFFDDSFDVEVELERLNDEDGLGGLAG